jgi:hypothetical protein
MAVQKAAAASWLRAMLAFSSGSRTPKATLFASRCCASMKSTSDPGSPPPGGHASRRHVFGANRG